VPERGPEVEHIVWFPSARSCTVPARDLLAFIAPPLSLKVSAGRTCNSLPIFLHNPGIGSGIRTSAALSCAGVNGPNYHVHRNRRDELVGGWALNPNDPATSLGYTPEGSAWSLSARDRWNKTDLEYRQTIW